MNNIFNFTDSSGSLISDNFAILPINYPTINGEYIVTGEPVTSSTSPATLDLVDNLYKVELNRCKTSNNWFINVSGSTITVVSGSGLSGSYCTVYFNLENSILNPFAASEVIIQPVNRNVLFNGDFVSGESMEYETDDTGALTASLIPQPYKVTLKSCKKNTTFNILPSGSSCNASDIIVTNSGVSTTITPVNSAAYGYTAAASDERYLRSGSVTPTISSSYATSASFAEYAVSASYEIITELSSSHADTASYVNQLNQNVIISGSLNFTSSATPTHKEGTMFYDYATHTMCVYNDQSDVTLNLGEEQYVRVVNKTGAPVLNGTVCTISGSQGNRPKLKLAQSSNSSTHGSTYGVIGVATSDIANNAEGLITIHGKVGGIDTSIWAEGDTLYVSSSAGVLTNVKPSFPYDVIKVGITLNSTNNGSIFISPLDAIHIDDLSGTGVFYGTASYADTASYLTPTNDYTVNNLTASAFVLPIGNTIDQGGGDRIRFSNNGSVGSSQFEFNDNDPTSTSTAVSYGKAGVYGMQTYGYDMSWSGSSIESYLGVTSFNGTDMGGSWLYNVYSGGGAGNTIFRTAGGEYNWLSQTQQLMKLGSDGHLQTVGGISAGNTIVLTPDVTAADGTLYFNTGGGQYTATGNYYEFHVYASKNGQFSQNPLIFSGTDPNDSSNFLMLASWDNMNVDFYRVIVVSDPEAGASGDYYFDTTLLGFQISAIAVGFEDNTNAAYSAGNTVTPNDGTVTPKFNVDGATGNVTASALSIGGAATFAGDISVVKPAPRISQDDLGVGGIYNELLFNGAYKWQWGMDVGGTGNAHGLFFYNAVAGKYNLAINASDGNGYFNGNLFVGYNSVSPAYTLDVNGSIGNSIAGTWNIDTSGIFKSVGNGIDTRINDNWGNVTGLYTNTSAVPNSIGVYATDNVGAVGAFCFQGSYGVYGFKGSSAMAGRFEDAANAVELCNGTNAISASGNVVVGGNVTAKGLSLGYSVQTVDYALTTDDYFILASGSAALTITLPDATTNAGKIYKVKNVSTYNVTLSGSQNIDNSNNLIINQWSAAEVISSGVSWFIV